MSYLVTPSTCITRAQQRANLEGATAFITAAEWLDMFNVSYAAWWDMVRLQPWAGQYARSTNTFNTSSGQSAYALPADFLSAISVDWFVSGSALVVNVLPFQEEHRNIFRFWPIGWLFNQPIFYQIWGSNIQFIPTPQSAFQIVLNYEPAAQVLTLNQTFDSYNGWEEWIVADMASNALIKDGQADMLGPLTAKKQVEEARIRQAAPARQRHAAEVVHDVVAAFDDWSNG